MVIMFFCGKLFVYLIGFFQQFHHLNMFPMFYNSDLIGLFNQFDCRLMTFLLCFDYKFDFSIVN